MKRLNAPFKQLPFDEVPEKPRIAHPYFDAELRDIRFRSRPFGDVTVRVRVMGEGPPLLLVHGFMTSSYSFRYVMEPLAKRFAVYVPDLIGAGESSKPRASYSADALAESIGELMAALKIEGASVIGNSLGGYLCMRLAMQDATKMSRLVNLHSPGLPTFRMHALRALMKMLPNERVVRMLVNRNPEKWVHTNVHYYDETLKSREEHRVYAAPLRTEEGLRAFVSMLLETLDVADMEQFRKSLKALPRFPIPLLLVYAKKDPMVPASVGEEMRRLLPDATFVWMERASHFAHVDAAERFLEVVLPFLTR